MLSTEYAFDIGAADAVPDSPASSEPLPTPGEAVTAPESAPDSGVQASLAAAAANTVLTAGDIRVTTAMEDDHLIQRLADYTSDPDGVPLDVATTVLAVPNGEAWPGDTDGEDPDLWNRIAPEHGQIWRTGTPAKMRGISLRRGENDLQVTR